MRGETQAGWRGLVARARGLAVATSGEVRGRIGGLVEAAPKERPTVFVSYRRKAEGVALGLVHDLRESAQAKRWEFFFDQLAIPPGAEWERYISDHLAVSWVMLLVVDRDWNEDGRISKQDNFVRREIELAAAHHVPVIPVLVDGSKLPDQDELPPSIGWLLGLKSIDLYNPQLRAVMVGNLADWLAEIRAGADDAEREAGKVRRASEKLTGEIEAARTGQSKAERDATEAAARQSACDAQLAEAERRLGELRAQIDPPRSPGRLRVLISCESETHQDGDRLAAKVTHALGAGGVVELRSSGGADGFDVVLALIGPQWLSGGGAAAKPVEEALSRGVPVFPLLVGRLKEPAADELPAAVRPLLAHNFLSLRAEFWEPATNRLVVQLEELDRLLERRERDVAGQQTTAVRQRKDRDRAAADLTRAQAAGRAAAETIATLEAQATQAHQEAERLEQLPADRAPAFVKGPPPIKGNEA